MIEKIKFSYSLKNISHSMNFNKKIMKKIHFFKKSILTSILFLGLITPNYLLTESLKEENKLNINYLFKTDESDYLLGPGDQINIVVSKTLSRLNTVTTIPASGYIFLSKLGKLYVSGLTANELTKLLQEKYEEIIINPQIEINITGYKPVRVLVRGEVDSPGLITLTGAFNLRRSSSSFTLDQMNEKNKVINNTNVNLVTFPTIFDAIQNAGGITNYSDLSKIEIIRKDTLSNGGGSKRTFINFLEYLSANSPENNIRVLDEDIIIISKSDEALTKQLSQALRTNLNPKFVSVFVSGRVKIPGRTTVTRTSSLSDAIDISGGAKFVRGPVTFIRFNSDGVVEKRQFRYNPRSKPGSYNNPYLRNGDIIRVGDNILTKTSEVLREFTDPLLRIYGTYKIFDD